MTNANLLEAKDQSSLWRTYCEILAADGHDNLPATEYQLAQYYRGINLAGKSVLDVGSGRGLMTLYAAINGAAKVTSMEPELDGSRSQVLDVQRERIERLELDNVTLLREDFNTWDPQGERFDVILSFASINHIHESPHHAYRDKDTYDNFLRITKKMHSLLNPGGVAIVTDACRYGLFWMLLHVGIYPPWTPGKKPSINWRIHQNPQTWRRLFLEAGFSQVDIQYPVPYKLRRCSRIVNTSLVNFCLRACFCLHCRRADDFV